MTVFNEEMVFFIVKIGYKPENDDIGHRFHATAR